MRRDEGDIGFGGPEPSRAEEQTQPEEPGGLLDRAKAKIEARQAKRVHQLPCGSYCSDAAWQLIQDGAEYIGLEGLQMVEEGSGSLARWARFNPRKHSLATSRSRVIVREYVRVPKGENRPHDEIIMIGGENGPTVIGHTASPNLLERVARFRPCDIPEPAEAAV